MSLDFCRFSSVHCGCLRNIIIVAEPKNLFVAVPKKLVVACALIDNETIRNKFELLVVFHLTYPCIHFSPLLLCFLCELLVHELFLIPSPIVGEENE